MLLEKQKRQKTQPHAVGRNLAMAHREILPDEVLQNVVNPKLLEAIKNDLLQRLKSQSQYLIRAWLGIQEFCQNARDLEVRLSYFSSPSRYCSSSSSSSSSSFAQDLHFNSQEVIEWGCSV